MLFVFTGAIVANNCNVVLQRAPPVDTCWWDSICQCANEVREFHVICIQSVAFLMNVSAFLGLYMHGFPEGDAIRGLNYVNIGLWSDSREYLYVFSTRTSCIHSINPLDVSNLDLALPYICTVSMFERFLFLYLSTTFLCEVRSENFLPYLIYWSFSGIKASFGGISIKEWIFHKVPVSCPYYLLFLLHSFIHSH